jgi:hypothetical protein
VGYLTFSVLEKSGRLGNQLWQIASTLGLARRHGLEPRFPTAWSYRPWFSIPDEYFADVAGARAWQLDDLAHMDERTRVYMQDLSFIAGVEDEIREWFTPTELAIPQVARACPAAALEPVLILHVRRGDNLTAQQCYPIPSIEYYLDAVRRHSDHDVIIYGDDWKWNRGVLEPLVKTLTHQYVATVSGVPRPKEHEPNYMTAPILDWVDLFAMALGHAFCLSNSTLGFWAAFLSGSSDVEYPKPWYGPELDVHQGQGGYIDGSLMFPGHWKEVDATGAKVSSA